MRILSGPFGSSSMVMPTMTSPTIASTVTQCSVTLTQPHWPAALRSGSMAASGGVGLGRVGRGRCGWRGGWRFVVAALLVQFILRAARARGFQLDEDLDAVVDHRLPRVHAEVPAADLEHRREPRRAPERERMPLERVERSLER